MEYSGLFNGIEKNSETGLAWIYGIQTFPLQYWFIVQIYCLAFIHHPILEPLPMYEVDIEQCSW